MQNQVLAFKAAGMYAHILALFILFQLEAAAQNLVPNPSFEILEACPTDAGQTALRFGIDIPGLAAVRASANWHG